MGAGSGTLRRTLAALAALALIIAWTAGVFTPKITTDQRPPERGAAVPADTETYTVEEHQLAPLLDVAGTVASTRKVHLSPRIPATVREVFVNAGDRVRAGQRLITLDDREIREQLNVAEAEYTRAQSDYQRTRALFERNATTDQNLTAAQSMYQASRAQLNRLKVMQSYATLTSPMEGVITERRVEAGDLAAPGQVLLTIYDPTRMRLEVPVPVRLIDNLALGDTLAVTLDGMEEDVRGTVNEIVSEVDPRSRTRLVKVSLPVGEILPGTFGRLWIPADARPGLCIPPGAVSRAGQLEFVYVVRDGRAIERLVKTGPPCARGVEILSGLRPGEQVLSAPLAER